MGLKLDAVKKFIDGYDFWFDKEGMGDNEFNAHKDLALENCFKDIQTELGFDFENLSEAAQEKLNTMMSSAFYQQVGFSDIDEEGAANEDLNESKKVAREQRINRAMKLLEKVTGKKVSLKEGGMDPSSESWGEERRDRNLENLKDYLEMELPVLEEKSGITLAELGYTIDMLVDEIYDGVDSRGEENYNCFAEGSLSEASFEHMALKAMADLKRGRNINESKKPNNKIMTREQRITRAIKLLEKVTGKKVALKENEKVASKKKIKESVDYTSEWSEADFSKLVKLVANDSDAAINIITAKDETVDYDFLLDCSTNNLAREVAAVLRPSECQEAFASAMNESKKNTSKKKKLKESDLDDDGYDDFDGDNEYEDAEDAYASFENAVILTDGEDFDELVRLGKTSGVKNKNFKAKLAELIRNRAIQARAETGKFFPLDQFIPYAKEEIITRLNQDLSN